MLNISFETKNNSVETVKNFEKVLINALKMLNQPFKQLRYNVYFVSKAKIRNLNKETRNIDKVTDVLSYPNLDIKAGEIININNYPYDIDYVNNTLLVGEIFICNQRAIEQAKEYGHDYNREICFLFLHGILHCLGYDHINDDDRVVMENLQDKILDACKIYR